MSTALRILILIVVVSSIVCPVTPVLADTIELEDPTEAELRTEITNASDDDEIVITVTAPQTVVLTSGELEIDEDLSITGPGADMLTLDGNGASAVIVCTGDATVSITGLTITGGNAPLLGGGVSTSGALTMNDCVLFNNVAAWWGGGVYCYPSGSLTLSNCTFEGNRSQFWGGAIRADGPAILVNCTFFGNESELGGGINAVEAGSSVSMTNCTVTGNSAENGGGCYVGEFSPFLVKNSVVAQNTASTGEGPDCSGHVFSFGGNIFGSTESELSHSYASGGTPPDLFDTDPLLGPLQNNGGATPTCRPLTGSPAIDGVVAGNEQTVYGDPVLTDQRGYTRPRDGDADGVPLCDIGACEFQRMTTMAFVDLAQGWNMVSVPLVPDDPDSGVVFAGVDAVYTWNPTAKSYTIPDDIEPWRGYWVAMSSATTIQIVGTSVTHWTQPDICRGWNMVGSVFDGGCSFTDPNDDPGGSVEGFAYWWDPGMKSYQYCTSIDPWKGYWVAATADCSLMVGPPDE